MSVVAAYLYRAGKRVRAISMEEHSPCSNDPSEFVWIGLLEPSQSELRGLQARFDLHPLAVEDALVAHQLPKVDVYGDQLFIVAHTAHFEGDRIAYGETSIFVGPSHVITVRHGSARAHTTLRGQLEASPALLAHGVDYVLHAILDFVVDGYGPIVQDVQENVLEMESHAVSAGLKRAEVMRIFGLRRELILFQRVLAPMGELCAKLVNLDMPCIDEVTKPYFQDVLDHVRRSENLVGGLREELSSVFEVSTLLEQQRQGVINRQLAAWAAILAVPTAIAGIYGMNFSNMPELHWEYGYFAVLTAIAGTCSVLYVRFKRSGWL
jgi:magnesium transporter